MSESSCEWNGHPFPSSSVSSSLNATSAQSMTGLKKYASARDVRVIRTRFHSRRTHRFQFNRDDQIAVSRTLQPSVPKSKVFRKIHYADLVSIAIAHLTRCVCAGVSMWVRVCENVYCQMAKIQKIKITDIELKDFQNPDESPFATAYMSVCNCNLSPYVCHHFRDIHSRNVFDLHFDLGNGLKPIERPYPCLVPIVMFALSVTVCEIFTVKCAWPWPWPVEWATVKYINITIEIPHAATSHVWAITMCALSVTSLRTNSEMSSIRTSDLECEGQGRWRFGWDLVDELICGN